MKLSSSDSGAKLGSLRGFKGTLKYLDSTVLAHDGLDFGFSKVKIFKFHGLHECRNFGRVVDHPNLYQTTHDPEQAMSRVIGQSLEHVVARHFPLSYIA